MVHPIRFSSAIIERALDFSPVCRINAPGDSIAPSPIEGRFCTRLCTVIANFFRRIFCCCFDRPEEGNEINRESRVFNSFFSGGKLFDATLEALPEMEEKLCNHVFDDGLWDPNAEEHLAIFSDIVKQMVMHARLNSQIEIKWLAGEYAAENGREFTVEAEITSKGGSFNPLEMLSQEQINDLQTAWNLHFTRDEANHSNKILIAMQPAIL